MSCVKLPRVVSLLALSSACLLGFGCGAMSPSVSAPQPVASAPSAVTISISPATAVMTAGDSLQFAALEKGSPENGVSWMVNGIVGGNSASGTISNSGLYTAPPEVSVNAKTIVAATSKADPESMSSAAVTVMPDATPVKVAITPKTVTLRPDQVEHFSASVSGAKNQKVKWLVNGKEGGNSTVGTISNSGEYTAPLLIPSAPILNVTAKSVYDSDSSAVAAVTIVAVPETSNPPPSQPSPPPSVPPSTPTPSHTKWNPDILGVSWASDFSSIAENEINVKTDSRLHPRAQAKSGVDDTTAIRAAIQLASSTGGGVVYFPAGDYQITAASGAGGGKPLVIPSKVILRGDGASASRLHINDPNAGSETDWTHTWGGINFVGSSQTGMTDLAVIAGTTSSSGALVWNRGSKNVNELFFNSIHVDLENSKTFWIEGADNVLVQKSTFESPAINNGGPVYIVGNSNVSFLKNQISYHFGRVHLQNNNNLIVQGNTLTRDAQNKGLDERTAIESGGLEISFGKDVQILNNTIETLNAPPGESGDGEAIMSQQSTIQNVLDVGAATAVTSTTLMDSHALWGSVTESRLAQYPEVVAILTGSSAGEWHAIKSVNTKSKTLTLDEPWIKVPEVGALYSVFTWTLNTATIQDNVLTGNPNGIVLWNGCYNCTVQGNTLVNSRGIVLRVVDEALNAAAYPEGRRTHDMAVDVKILNNSISNDSGLRPAYLTLDTEAFDKTNYRGTGMMNIQIAGNVLTPYAANPNQAYPKVELSQEGYFPCFYFGPAPAKDPMKTVFRNISFENNSQSTPVNYTTYFSQYATRTCTTSAP